MLINNEDDCRKYYEETFVQFKEEGLDKLFFVLSVGDGHMFVRQVQDDGALGSETIGVNIENGYNMDFILPRKACFNHHKRSLFLSRIPEKQWKKGIHSQNTIMMYLSAVGDWRKLPFSAQYLIRYISKNAWKHCDNLELTTESMALNTRLSLSANGYVFLDRTYVGLYNRGENTIKCHPLVHKEVLPYFSHAKVL